MIGIDPMITHRLKLEDMEMALFHLMHKGELIWFVVVY